MANTSITSTPLYIFLTYLAGVFSVLLNLAPIVTVRKLEAVGSVGPMPVTFFGAQIYSAALWASYGLYSSSVPLLIANILGNAVGTYCALVYLSVARREEKSGRVLQAATYKKSVGVWLFFVSLVVVHLAVNIGLLMSNHYGGAVQVTGYEGSIASLVMLGAPVAMFKTIIQRKNAEGLQPLMVSFAFINTLCWTIAGFMTLDPFILVPNSLCFLACAAQLALIVKFGIRVEEKEEIHEAIATVPFD